MRRGDLVMVALAGDFGKPRPALVIQSDAFATNTVTVALMSTSITDAPLLRLTVEPTPENGLQKTSQVMVDRSMTVRCAKVGQVFGRLDDRLMLAVNRSLALFLGFA